mgnify:CR=1 FL=1
MTEKRDFKEVNCGTTSISIKIETWQDRFDKNFPNMPNDGKRTVKAFIHSEIEKARIESYEQGFSDRKLSDKASRIVGARELVERIDKNCELYEKPINNTECEFMIRHDDIKKQLAEMERETNEKKKNLVDRQEGYIDEGI